MPEGSVHTIQLPDEVDVAVVSALRNEIAQVLHHPPTTFVLEFGAVNFIDSVGLGLLVSTQRRCDESGVALRLEHVGENVAQVFAVSGLAELFVTT